MRGIFWGLVFASGIYAVLALMYTIGYNSGFGDGFVKGEDNMYMEFDRNIISHYERKIMEGKL